MIQDSSNCFLIVFFLRNQECHLPKNSANWPSGLDPLSQKTQFLRFFRVCEAVTRRYVSCGNWWRLIRLSVPSDYIRRPLVFISLFHFHQSTMTTLICCCGQTRKYSNTKDGPGFLSVFLIANNQIWMIAIPFIQYFHSWSPRLPVIFYI